MSLFWRLFGLSEPVDRGFYLKAGLSLFTLRCIGDSLILFATLGQEALSSLHPMVYLAPTILTRSAIPKILSEAGDVTAAVILLTLWVLPFLWIGFSMTLRRAHDAGWRRGLALLFLLPVVNLFLVVALSIVPSRGTQREPVFETRSINKFRVAFSSIASASVPGVLAAASIILGLEKYGSALFVALPVLIGLIAGWRINRDEFLGYRAGLGAAFLAAQVTFALMVFLALEGIVCIAMLWPLGTTMICFGSLLGTAIASMDRPSVGTVSSVALVFPLFTVAEMSAEPELPLYEVVTEIQIDAPPESVWPNVVGFSELPPPQDWVLKAGIATPMRARIEGEGPGAIRYCEFTTGDFVEPITIWNPPHRLAFDVTSQPPAMEEWSPWEEVYAPHIEDTMISRRGEFLLQQTDDGGTLLRGTTWYTLDLHPGIYWKLWSDPVVQRIHRRVLKHIKTLSEEAEAS